ncbi:MAG TPA: LytR C-terminal domain-containing protein [Rhodothermales bacterium]|nr:LytR C-terminal domain-containing protein [Rhodothermales bacterium]
MREQPKRRGGVLLNAVLVLGGLLVAVLLYAFVSRMLAPRAEPALPASGTAPVADILQVQVLNGCGVSGLAGDVTLYLRRHGFDVVEVGDVSSGKRQRSVVIDRVGNLNAARQVAAALGISPEQVTQDIDPDLYLDATVIIGQDYKELKSFENE